MCAAGKKKEEGMGEKELLREINDKLGRLNLSVLFLSVAVFSLFLRLGFR